MRLSEAIAKIQQLKVVVFEGREAAALLNTSPKYASKILHRLMDDKLVIKLHGNKWILAGETDRYAVGSHLMYPLASYISLQTALFHHGMVSQIPSITYCISLARTQRINTPIGAFSIHHLQPDFFFGFHEWGNRGAQIATPEKALIDVLYLSQTKSRLFKKLPEIEFPKSFSIKYCRTIIEKIKSIRRRASVEEAFDHLFNLSIFAWSFESYLRCSSSG